MKKIFKVLGILILVMFVGVVLAIGYFGFVPGLSELMGSTKPRNLGVKYSQADFQAYNQKTNTEIITMTTASASGETISFSNPKEMNVTLTEAEVSARIGNSIWKYMPLTNFQIRFPGKDTLEFSANLATDRLAGFIAQVGETKISQADIDAALQYLKIVTKNPPIYAKAQVKVRDNKVDIVMEKFEFGRIPIPTDKTDFNSGFKKLAEDIFAKNETFYAKSVTFDDGKMIFEGKAPTNIAVLGAN